MLELTTSLLGIVNPIAFGMAVIFFFFKSKIIHPKKYTISELSIDKNLGNKFDLTFFIFAIIQTIFTFIVADFFKENYLQPEILLFTLGGIALIVSSIVSVKRHIIFHIVSAAISMSLATIAAFIFSLNLLSTYPVFAYILLSATLLVPLSFLLRNKLKGAYWEFLLIAGVFFWNTGVSILIYYR